MGVKEKIQNWRRRREIARKRERFWEFEGRWKSSGEWLFRSTDYDMEEILLTEWDLGPSEWPLGVVKLVVHYGEIMPMRRAGATITKQQAEAAHQWAIEQDLFGQSDRGVTRIDVPDDVRGF